MEQRITINAENTKGANAKKEAMRRLADWLMEPVDWLTDYYSRLIEEKLNRSQTLWLVNAQVALIAAVFPADISLMARAINMLWFGWVLEKCGEALHKQ